MTDFAEFHGQLREVARDALSGARRSSTDAGVPAPVDWDLLVSSGWLGLEAPERLDGSGATFAEVAVVLAELGRAGTGDGYLSSAVLGIGALNLLGGGADRDDLLRRVMAGRARLAVALGAGDVTDSPVAFDLRRSADALQLQGEAGFVPGASEADRILVLARDSGGTVVVAVTPGTAGLSVSATELTDPTRSVATVRAEAVAVDPDAVWPLADDGPDGAWSLFDRAALAVACDSLGVAERMMEATVEYARVREQFGRPIGSFQAVKHACSDMLVRLSVSRELVSEAADGIARDDPDRWVATAQAKSYTCEAAVEVVGKAMQLHGGIGYTWESGIHAYMKRVLFNRSWFGSPVWHRRRLARRYL